MSQKNVTSTLLEQIGFTEEEQKVYFTILGIGTASLGEIYLQTEIPFEELQPIVAELTGRGYLKKIKGKINRYIAVEPFLKGFLFVEKDFQNDIIGIENSLINAFEQSNDTFARKMDEFLKSIPPIFNKVTEELRNANEELKMELTDSIYRHSERVEGLSDDLAVLLRNGFDQVQMDFENELNQLVNDISIILREEQENASSKAEKFEDLTNKTIEGLLAPLDQAIKEFQETIPPEVKDILDDNKKAVSSLKKDLRKITKEKMKELRDALKENEKTFNDMLKEAIDAYKDVITSYEEQTHSLFESEKENLDEALKKLKDAVGQNIDALAKEANSLQEDIKEMAGYGIFKKPSEEFVQEILGKTEKIVKRAEVIQKAYSDAVKVYQTGIINGLEKLIEQSDTQLKEQLKQGSEAIKKLDKKISSSWSKTAKAFSKDLNKTIAESLKESHSKITNTSKLALNIVDQHLGQLRKDQATTLIPLRETVLNDVETLLENLFYDSTKRLRLYNESNQKMMQSIQSIIDNSYHTFTSNVKQALGKSKVIASEMISEYTGKLDDYLTNVDRDKSDTIEALNEAGEEFLNSLKDTSSHASNEISNRLAALVYKVNETRTYLEEITDAVDEITPLPRPHSLIVYGNTNVQTAIRDMLLRTRSTCTVVLPTVDEEVTELLSKKITKRVRIRILADLDPFDDEALVASLKEKGNISLWQYQMRDFYAVTRDGAEVLLAPVTREGELTAFVTEQDALVRAIQQIINASFMARSKEL
jgi:sugar-specific transcriptional regulator TrmB/gas vesicle protein